MIVQPSPSPAPSPRAVIVQGPVASQPSTPSAIYEGFRAQRRELEQQLQTLEHRREEISGALQQPELDAAATAGLEARLAEVDKRIAGVDQAMAEADAALARAAAVPGAVVEFRPPPRSGPPEEAYVLGALFMLVTLLPISIAYARRIWRRSAVAVSAIPHTVGEQLTRLEQSVESIAIEVERLGEGQRFMAKVMTEQGAPREIGRGAAEPLPIRARESIRERAE